MKSKGRALAGGMLLLAAALLAACLPDGSMRREASDPRDEDTVTIAQAFLREWLDGGGQASAYRQYAAVDMVQHDPRIADGLRGVLAFLQEGSGSRDERASLLNMVLVDGDLFAIHRIEFSDVHDTGTATVEIWRTAHGRIVEHWSVRQPVPEAMPHENGMGCGTAQRLSDALAQRDPVSNPSCGLPNAAMTRAASIAVFDGYTTQVAQGDVEAAMKRWLTDDYRQHSPMIADGIDGALDFLMDEFGKGDAAMPRFGPMRTLVEGDLVLKHRITFYADGRQTANVDIFRMTNGQVSEHWDVIQPMPAQSANRNGMW